MFVVVAFRGAFCFFFVFELNCCVGLFCAQNQRNDKSVQTEHFGENEDQNHSDEKSRLLRRSSNTGVADDANSVAGG